jgi:glycosyltransferase
MKKLLSIILPSYQDDRIANAIQSIRRFDDQGCVKIIVIDGGSDNKIICKIQSLLSIDDILIAEPDKGIFDGLNKGLDISDTEFIGWLGSDDEFTGQVLSSDVIKNLKKYDMFVANCVVFKGDRVRRLTHAFPSTIGLVRLGLHNPHFSTFGKACLFKSIRFNLNLMGSDIEYFIKIFSNKPSVKHTSLVSTMQAEGGYSSKSNLKILRINYELIRVYSNASNPVIAVFAVVVKLSYKLLSTLHYKIFPKYISDIKSKI